MSKNLFIFAAIIGIIGLILIVSPYINSFSFSNSRVFAEDSAQIILRQGEKTLPPVDPTHTNKPNVRIPKIGVNALITRLPSEKYEDALRKGVWMSKEFNTPMDKGTTIIAGHRYGYLNWSNKFRKKNSFANLPKLKAGDTIKINWERRTFEYAIYKIETGSKITDNNADLILYTCNDLFSNLRIFVYAKRIN